MNTISKKGSFKHGMSRTSIYQCWLNIKMRCLNYSHPQYKHYGGRGITVCKGWLKFENFYKDMGERPKGKSIDRINNNGNYCKENCRWATAKEQCRNRRSNFNITYKGENKCLAEWVEILKISRNILRNRI